MADEINRAPRQFDGNGNNRQQQNGAQGANGGNNRFRNNNRRNFHNRPFNGQRRDNRENGENQSFQPRKQFEKRPEKPIETAEDIAKDTERLMKEIELEISEIKAIDVSL